MTALLRYQTALLCRSFRWLPPLLLYVAIMGIGMQGGQPLLDSLGYGAAFLLPVAAWLVRVCVIAEPASARACTAAAAGPGRAHLARLLTALGASAVIGTVGTLFILAVSDPHASDHRTPVPRGQAAAAGLLAVAVCALLGTAVGALTNAPVLRRPGWAVPVTGLAAVVVLVAAGSPANAAVSGLVTGSETGRVPLPLLPLLFAATAAAAATALACALSSRRDW